MSSDVCECGCGRKVKPGRRHIRGHGKYGNKLPKNLCACGCGSLIPAYSKYAKHHWHAMRTRQHHEAMLSQVTAGLRGVCECGCGQPAAIGKRYKRGCGPYMKPPKPCKCGCGDLVQPPYVYVAGHAQKTDEWKEKTFTETWHKNRLDGIARSLLERNTRVNQVAENLFRLTEVKMPIREYVLGGMIVDFAWPDRLIALEVQGCRWHACSVHPETWANRSVDEVREQRDRDERKASMLKTSGWELILLWEHDVLMGILDVDLSLFF